MRGGGGGGGGGRMDNCRKKSRTKKDERLSRKTCAAELIKQGCVSVAETPAALPLSS